MTVWQLLDNRTARQDNKNCVIVRPSNLNWCSLKITVKRDFLPDYFKKRFILYHSKQEISIMFWPTDLWLPHLPKYFYYKIRKLRTGDNRFWVDSALFLELRLSRAIWHFRHQSSTPLWRLAFPKRATTKGFVYQH